MINARWIWINKKVTPDQYAEFLDEFTYRKGKINIHISADSIFAIFLNDQLVNFSQCSDYPDFKIYDVFDLTNHVKKGKNFIKIQVWYHGENTQCYKSSNAGLIYEIINDNNVITYSSNLTRSREMNEYQNNYKKIITPQLGFSFKVNLNSFNKNYSNSIEINKTYDLNLRKQNALYLEERRNYLVIENNESIVIDLQKESAGFLDLEFDSDISQNILISYGEHLRNGHVARIIGPRDFSVEIIAKSGHNKYLNPFRRLGARYLEIYPKSPLKIKYIGIRNVYYPVEVINKNFEDELVNKIYNVSVTTLRLCMHEHYEDCPWREQCLYNLDSRNQMICGYYAFKGFDYQRSNLLLIKHGLRNDGLLSLCFPAGLDFPIPLFSLTYLQQVYEYVKFSNDFSIINELKETLICIKNTFVNKIDKTGLIPNFTNPEIWNFTEWNVGLDGNDPDYKTGKRKYDLCLNAYFVYAIEMFNKLIPSEAFDVNKMKAAIVKTFLDSKTQMFKISNNSPLFSQLGNSLAILAGLETPDLKLKIMECKDMIPATLSMKTFVYDALLLKNDKYKNFVIDEIINTYKNMLDNGATSFWETIKGSDDFDGAGSLCHGWSAIPIIYFNKLL